MDITEHTVKQVMAENEDSIASITAWKNGEGYDLCIHRGDKAVFQASLRWQDKELLQTLLTLL